MVFLAKKENGGIHKEAEKQRNNLK